MATNNIVPIFSRGPSQAGPARCIQCGHTWEEIEMPVGSANIPCPKCLTNRGAFIGLSSPENPLVCPECDNDLFFLDGDDGSYVCAKCGDSGEIENNWE